MKQMKISFRRFHWNTLIIATLCFFIFSCQTDEFFQSDQQGILKDAPLPPQPGEYLSGCGWWDLQLPDNWNSLSQKVILVYCHGMVNPVPYSPVELPDDEVNGKPVSQIILEQGWAYAATSYSDNGLIAATAVENVKVLVEYIKNSYLPSKGLSSPDLWLIAGPSEGGLVTVLSLERHPELFDGGVSICGPIGNFYNQTQYNGDFNVLFNYFFPGWIGNPQTGMSDPVMASWNSPASPLRISIIAELQSNPSRAVQLIRTSKATIDTSDPLIAGQALLELLDYNIMLTNNVTALLHGVVFNNKYRLYTGSSNDFMLNKNVQRILTPDYNVAKNNLQLLETTGNIQDPLITLHTTGDHIVPAWHQTLYRAKVWAKGKALYYTGIPVVNYGHCTISESDLQNAIVLLMLKIKLRSALS